MPFDPDKYLTGSSSVAEFDPDAYLNTPDQATEEIQLNAAVDEEAKNYPSWYTNPQEASDRAGKTFDMAANNNLPIDSVERNYDELKTWDEEDLKPSKLARIKDYFGKSILRPDEIKAIWKNPTFKGYVPETYEGGWIEETKARGLYAALTAIPIVSPLIRKMAVLGESDEVKKEFNKIIDKMPDDFTGLGSLTAKPTAEIANLALSWAYVYPAAFKLVGLTNKTIASIPIVAKAGKVISKMGGLEKVAAKFPRIYQISKNAIEAGITGSEVFAGFQAFEGIGEGTPYRKQIKDTLIAGGKGFVVGAAFNLASSADQALYIRKLRNTMTDSLRAEIKSAQDQFDKAADTAESTAQIGVVDGRVITIGGRGEFIRQYGRGFNAHIDSLHRLGLQQIDSIVAASEAELFGITKGDLYGNIRGKITSPQEAAKQFMKGYIPGESEVFRAAKVAVPLKKGLGETEPFIKMPTTRVGEVREDIGQVIKQIRQASKFGITKPMDAAKAGLTVGKAPKALTPGSLTAQQEAEQGKEGIKVPTEAKEAIVEGERESQFITNPIKSQEKKPLVEWMYDFSKSVGNQSSKSEAVYFDGPFETRLRFATHEAVYNSSATAFNVALKEKGDQDADIVLSNEDIGVDEFEQVLRKWYEISEKNYQEEYADDEDMLLDPPYGSFDDWLDSNLRNNKYALGKFNAEKNFPFAKKQQAQPAKETIVGDKVAKLQGSKALPEGEARDLADGAIAELDRALDAGEMDEGTHKLAKHLIENVDATFDKNSTIEVIGAVRKATPEIIKREGLPTTDPKTGKEIEYGIYGETVSNLETFATRTAVQLYRGHDADTVVEEWYHRAYDRLSGAKQKLFEEYHKKKKDSRSVNEHFAQEGRDYYFNLKLHETAAGIKRLFQMAKDSFNALTSRIRKLRGGIVRKMPTGWEVWSDVPKRQGKKLGKKLAGPFATKAEAEANLKKRGPRIPQKILDLYKQAGKEPDFRQTGTITIPKTAKEKRFERLQGIKQPRKSKIQTTEEKKIASLKKIANKAIKEHPLYQEGVALTEEARLARPGGSLSGGKYYVGPTFRGEVAALPSNVRSHIVFDKAKANSWDEGDQPFDSFDDFITTLTEDIEAAKATGVLNQSAVEFASGDPSFQFLMDNLDRAEEGLNPLSEEAWQKLNFPQIVEEPRDKDLLGREELRGGVTGSQIEFLNKEDFLTLKERERIVGKDDIEGQQVAFQIRTLPEQNKPIWYSKLQKTIEDKMQPTMEAEQFKGWLSKQGIKAEELDWSGVNELTGKITKQQVLDTIAANNIQIEEVERGEAYYTTDAERARYEELANKGWNNLTKAEQAEHDDLYDRLGAAGVDQTKFSRYQLPGGKNYREMLLRLPAEIEQGSYAEYEKKLIAKYGLKYNEKMTEVERKKAISLFGRYKTEAGRSEVARQDVFRSSHFDETNILAHIRMNDRTDAQGNKVLFIEEIQSDWHQAGRKKGYRKEPYKTLPEGYFVQGYKFDKDWIKVSDSKATHFWAHSPDGKQLSQTDSKSRKEATEKGIRTLNKGWDSQSGAVPDAPFKKTWQDLAFKRMLRYAVENGYDKLAWTTGEQQAERYDLSKQVEEIVAIKGKAGISLTVIDNNGMNVIDSKLVQPNELDNIIGKELSDKIRQQKESEKSYTGIDLKVGGEGMKGFYDQIIPAFVNKYTKKWGGRVGETTLGKVEPPLIQMGNEKARQMAETKVHSLDITDPMKLDVMAGQPMFAIRQTPESKKAVAKAQSDQEKKGRELRKKIHAVAAVKGLTDKALTELKAKHAGFRTLTGARAIKNITNEQLESLLAAVRKQRPKTVDHKKVLTKKQENKISSLKDNLINMNHLTEADYADILQRETRGKEAKYTDAQNFITQSEASEVIKRIHNQAEITRVVESGESAIRGNTEVAQQVYALDKTINDKRAKMRRDPWQFESMRHFNEAMELKTGAPFYALYLDITKTHSELTKTRAARLEELNNKVPNFKKIAGDAKALERVSLYISSQSRLQTPIPVGITEDEKLAAKAIQDIFKDYENKVRWTRFYWWYKTGKQEGSYPIGDYEDNKDAIKKAVDIYESKGKDATIKYLNTQKWGVIKSGYEPMENITQKVRMYQPKPTTVGKSHAVEVRTAVEYNKQERTILQRLPSYMRQIDMLHALSPKINAYIQLYEDNAHKFNNPARITEAVQNYMQVLKGYNAQSTIWGRAIKRMYAQAMRAIIVVDVTKAFRNKFQNAAFYPDRTDFFDPRNKLLTDKDIEYVETYVQQQRAMIEEWFMMGEKAMPGLKTISKLADKVKTYPWSDVSNRYEAFWAKINRVRRSLKADTTAKMMQQAKFSDMSDFEQRMALTILARDGEDEMARFVAATTVADVHWQYERSQRSPAEMGGEMSEIFGNLMLFPRSYGEKLVREANKMIRGKDHAEQLRAMKVLISIIVGGMITGEIYKRITGKKRNPYGPLVILSWQTGGLAQGVIDQVNETYGNMIQAVSGDEKALARFLNTLPQSANMFIPFYDQALRGIEALTDMKNIDFKAVRHIREAINSEYKVRDGAYNVERDALEKWQYFIGGSGVDQKNKKDSGISGF